MLKSTSLHTFNRGNDAFLQHLKQFDIIAIPGLTSRMITLDREAYVLPSIEWCNANGKPWYSPWILSGGSLPRITLSEALGIVQGIITQYPQQPSWIVVNEAFAAGMARHTPWSKHGDTAWIEAAFCAAAEANPSAQLILKDYRARDRGHWQGILRFVDAAIERGVPIHGVSVQVHANALPPIPAMQLDWLFTQIRSRGLALWLDETLSWDLIWQSGLRMPSVAAEQVQAANYKAWVELATKHGAEVLGIWHPWDGHTPHWDKHPNHCGLWRSDWSPKPALQQFFR